MLPKDKVNAETESNREEVNMPSKTTPPQMKRLLVINPNTSQSMTNGLENLIEELGPSPVFQIETYTAKSGPASINDEKDTAESAVIVLREIEEILDDYDAILVACYSVHPLVSRIRERVHPSAHVTGIFEASITTAMALLPQRWGLQPLIGNDEGYRTFGIVSTGSYWKESLSSGVMDFLGAADNESTTSYKFQGVETTGLTAGELHTANQEDVKQKVKEATKRLLEDRACAVVCLGCAGMAGMDETVREAIVEELGEEDAEFVRIVDGVKAGIGFLEGLARTMPDSKKKRRFVKPGRVQSVDDRGELA